MKFCSGGMLAATRVKLSDSDKKSEQEHVQQFLHKTCKLRSFWKFHVAVVQNNRKEMYKTSELHVQGCFFAN